MPPCGTGLALSPSPSALWLPILRGASRYPGNGFFATLVLKSLHTRSLCLLPFHGGSSGTAYFAFSLQLWRELRPARAYRVTPNPGSLRNTVAAYFAPSSSLTYSIRMRHLIQSLNRVYSTLPVPVNARLTPKMCLKSIRCLTSKMYVKHSRSVV